MMMAARYAALVSLTWAFTVKFKFGSGPRFLVQLNGLRRHGVGSSHLSIAAGVPHWVSSASESLITARLEESLPLRIGACAPNLRNF